jgi:hypothetical protein
MTKKRRTEITIETHNLTIIRLSNMKSNSVYCGNCGAHTAVFAEQQAALIFCVEPHELERLASSEQIHRASEFALCGNSLADYFKKEIRLIED